MNDWTDANPHDPGITLLEGLFWTAAGLLTAVVLILLRRSARPARPASGRAKHAILCRHGA